jgi:lipopolysaccharide export system protein LptA
MKKRWMFAALSLMALTARAEHAESQAKTTVSYDKMEVDAASQVRRATGNVVLRRGTLQLTSDSAELRQGADGMLVLTMSGVPGKPATFRQKRGGAGDRWVEGQAQQLAYDEKGGVVELKGDALLRELDGVRQLSQSQSSHIAVDLNDGATAPRGAAGGSLVVAPRAGQDK